MPNPVQSLADRLKAGIVIGDGAIGTLLYQRGCPLHLACDTLNLDDPDEVSQIHRDYIQAGAQLVITNTYGANRVKLAAFGRESLVGEINRKGVELAMAQARGAEHQVYVAGSVGPISATPSEILNPEVKEQLYREQIDGLLSGGVEILFFETFNKVSELALAVRIAKRHGADTIIASMSFSDDGHTADGHRINEAFAILRSEGADVVGVNCQSGPMGAENRLRELEVREGDLVSAYPNAGRPVFQDNRYLYRPNDQYFGRFARHLASQGARLIGGCCGTTPETIAAVKDALKDVQPIATKPGAPATARSSVVVDASPGAPPAAPDLLDVIRQRTLIVTELDPPKSLATAKLLKGAQALKDAGTDFVTLADNSLAILRVSNLASGYLIKDQTGLDPVIHLACRDRNLLGLQSELMGLHALGIRHVLALTGDPAKVGDHPGAKSVYDVNSIGLIKTITRMNEGFASNGRDLKQQTRFVIGCAFNPNARNIDSQVRKLEDKLKAGARFVMTQPIFDPALADVTYQKTKHLDVPVLVGVMPLLSGRNAEFLHNEVPGIVISDDIRNRLKDKRGPEAVAIGLDIARGFCDAILDRFQGIYLITPLMRYDITVELSRYVRAKKRS